MAFGTIGDFAKDLLGLSSNEITTDNTAKWLARYLEQGSWRGVPFFISRAERVVGRKTAVHLFPGKDEPYTEDLGRAQRQFAFDAYIIGDDYFSHRDSLAAACEEEGPGKLIHPYLGELDVVLSEPASIVESTSEGRIARFRLSFREQKTSKLTIKTINTKSNINTKTKSSYDALRDWFKEVYDLSQEPVEVAQAVLVAIDKAADIILDAKKVVSSVADFQAVVDNIKGKILQIAFDTEDLFNDMLAAISFGTDFTNKNFAGESKRQFYELQQLANRLATESSQGHVGLINAMTSQIAIISMNEMIATMEFDSRQDAEEAREKSFELLNEIQLNPNTFDIVFAAISDNKASIEEDFEDRIEELGELFDYNVLEESMPSITISNAIYGNINNEEDIIARNKIQNPFFISSPEPLKVIINVSN